MQRPLIPTVVEPKGYPVCLDSIHACRLQPQTLPLFSQIVGERHIGLRHEAPNIVAVITQSSDQIGGLALLGSAAFASGGFNGIF